MAANHHPTSSMSVHTVDGLMANVAQMWGNVYSLFTNFAVIGMSFPYSVNKIPYCKVAIHQSGVEQGLNPPLLKFFLVET